MAELEPAVFGWLRARRAQTEETDHADRLAPIQVALEQAISAHTWLLGETFTIPDVFVASMIGTVVRRELGEPGQILRDYAARALDRPANLAAEAIR
jgi:glutathione S-transferase